MIIKKSTNLDSSQSEAVVQLDIPSAKLIASDQSFMFLHFLVHLPDESFL